MLQSLRANWQRLREGTAGRRFEEFYEQRRMRREDAGSGRSRVLVVGAGILLLVGGLAIGWLPGPGGFVSILGAALIATEYRPLARLLDRTEVLARRAWRWAARTWGRSSPVTKMLIVLMLAGAVAALVYLTVKILWA